MGWNETLILWLLKSGRVTITIYLKTCIRPKEGGGEGTGSWNRRRHVCHDNTNRSVHVQMKAAIGRHLKMEKDTLFQSWGFL